MDFSDSRPGYRVGFIAQPAWSAQAGPYIPCKQTEPWTDLQKHGTNFSQR